MQSFNERILEIVDDYLKQIEVALVSWIVIISAIEDYFESLGKSIVYFGIFWISILILVMVTWRKIKIMSSLKKSLNESNETITKQEKKLEEQINQINAVDDNIFMLFDGYLIDFAKRLKIDNDPKSRISIYVHDRDNKSFSSCARYSYNPSLCNKGRRKYPDAQGCIAVAWSHKWCFDNKFPLKRSLHANRCLKKYKIDQKTHDNMNMLPGLYAALRLENAAKRPLAIIVFESEDKKRFSQDEIKKILDDGAKKFTDSISVFQEQILIASTKGVGL